MNPFFSLNYEPTFESLGDDYYDVVPAAQYPQHMLRFRNDDLLTTLGLDPQTVGDRDFIEAFGQFRDRAPLLAMRYHGYQFGEYNPFLGDGRGFLYGQLRGIDGELYDLGTKGSGTTPYSRGGDGRLTLKGGVREVLAAEMLHRLGVHTSRCLSLIETGEQLWRGDEPSPTRSSVMVRVSRSHIRFGTFERLHYLERPDLVQPLLDHVIDYYYPHLTDSADRYAQFYTELVQRVARLVAQWMSVGFCHAVLNTDNMSITGESFDYGPYAFIDRYDPRFTAAYFDYMGRYRYAHQPLICRWNLEMLQLPLGTVISQTDMDAALAQFDDEYADIYHHRMLNKLGFDTLPDTIAQELLNLTLQLLQAAKMDYHDLFLMLRQQFSPEWRDQADLILQDEIFEANSAPDAMDATDAADAIHELAQQWRDAYHRALNAVSQQELGAIKQRLSQHNPTMVLVRPEIEMIWESIVVKDDWQPFYELLKRIHESVED